MYRLPSGFFDMSSLLLESYILPPSETLQGLGMRLYNAGFCFVHLSSRVWGWALQPFQMEDV